MLCTFVCMMYVCVYVCMYVCTSVYLFFFVSFVDLFLRSRPQMSAYLQSLKHDDLYPEGTPKNPIPSNPKPKHPKPKVLL